MKKQASQLDVLSIKRKISSINSNIDDSDTQVITKLDEVNTSVLNTVKSTKEVNVFFTNLSANSVDFSGASGGATFGSWASPYVVDKWHPIVDVTGKGEVNWISFTIPRQIFTAEAGKLNYIKCTIDGVELFNESTTFVTQDAATSREYVLLGVCIGAVRFIQSQLYFSKSLLIEIYSEYTVKPLPYPLINYQIY